MKDNVTLTVEGLEVSTVEPRFTNASHHKSFLAQFYFFLPIGPNILIILV
jgi:hypothetical protein